MIDRSTPETQATPENHARAQAFDRLVESNFALADSVKKLVRMNGVLVVLVAFALAAASYTVLRVIRGVRIQAESNTHRIEVLESKVLQ